MSARSLEAVTLTQTVYHERTYVNYSTYAMLYSLSLTSVCCASTESASAAVNCSVFAEWFIEQNLGPHIEQNAASLKPSSGSVSSCIAWAVSGSSESSNCRRQSNR